MLNTANGQTAGLDRVVVDAGNEYVAEVVAAAVTSPEILWTLTDSHIATLICAFPPKNLQEVNRAQVVSCW